MSSIFGTSVFRTLSGTVAVLGLAAVVTACQPGSLPPAAGGPNPPAAPSTAPSTSAPAVSPSASVSPTDVPMPPTTAPAPTTTQPGVPPTTRPPAPPTSRPPTTTPPVVTSAPAGGTKADEIVRLTNIERSKAGCGPLTADSRLATAAQAHSADMAAQNYFSHTSLDGRTFDARIHAAGFPGGSIAENIAAGNSTPAATMEQWMNSAGHRANILNCSYNRLGVGYAEGGSYRYYWTQDFGRL